MTIPHWFLFFKFRLKLFCFHFLFKVKLGKYTVLMIKLIGRAFKIGINTVTKLGENIRSTNRFRLSWWFVWSSSISRTFTDFSITLKSFCWCTLRKLALRSWLWWSVRRNSLRLDKLVVPSVYKNNPKSLVVPSGQHLTLFGSLPTYWICALIFKNISND